MVSITFKTVLVSLLLALVVSSLFIDAAEAKRKTPKGNAPKTQPVADPASAARKSGAKIKGEATTTTTKEEINVKTADGESLDDETMAKIKARIKEKKYEPLIKDHQEGRVQSNDPEYKAMIDDLIQQTVKIELKPVGTEVIEERELTPEEEEEERRRLAAENREKGYPPAFDDKIKVKTTKTPKTPPKGETENTRQADDHDEL